MRIVIPTRGRTGQQLTLNGSASSSGLPKELYPNVTIVCPAGEARYHTTRVQVVAQPDATWTIARKRRWILEELCAKDEKVVMLDDDLRFCVRREDNPMYFRSAKPEDVLRAFKELEEQLSPQVPHAGFAARQMSINPAAQRGGWQTAKRMMYVLGYHVPTVLANAELGRIETREDFDLTLQLLVKGFPNAVSYTYQVDQKIDRPGGCTGERTWERSNADALKLKEYFPEFVKVIEKKYRDNTRLEVQVQWQKILRAHVNSPRG
jgi:hypothetical protein